MGWAFPVCKLAQKPWTASEHSNTFHCMSWSKQEKDQQYIQYAYATECQNHKGPNFHLVSANLLLSELPTHSSCQNMQLGHVHAKRYPNNPCMQEMSLHCQPQWNHIMHPKWITHLAAFFSLGTPISKCCNNSWSSFSWHSSKATSSLEGLPVAQKGYSTCCMDRTWKKQITSPTTANMMHDNNKNNCNDKQSKAIAYIVTSQDIQVDPRVQAPGLSIHGFQLQGQCLTDQHQYIGFSG